MIVDFHIHWSPPATLQGVTGIRTVYDDGVPVYLQHARLGDEHALVETLEAAGVDRGVLSSGPGMWGDLDRAIATNEAAAELCARHPDRLLFLAHAAPQTGDAGLREVERWLDHCPGAAVPSVLPGANLDDPVLEPFYALLAARRRFLFVHPALAPTESERRTYDAYDMYRTVGREFSMVMAVMRLVCGGVLDRHPDLRVVISHLGGGITSVVPRIRHYQDKVMWGVADDPRHGRRAAEPFDSYLGRLYFDTGGFFGEPEAVRAALLHIPRSQILLGSDYPQEIRGPDRIRGLIGELRAQGILGQGTELLQPPAA